MDCKGTLTSILQCKPFVWSPSIQLTTDTNILIVASYDTVDVIKINFLLFASSCTCLGLWRTDAGRVLPHPLPPSVQAPTI